MTSNVLNEFKQTPGPLGAADNEFVMGGTVSSPSGTNLKTIRVNARIDDVSTAQSGFLAPGFAGSIVGITSSLGGAITGADATLTFEIGGVLVTGGDITITQSGSAAGDVDSSTPTAANVFTATDSIEFITDGGSTGTVPVVLTFELQAS